jgi:hypothetical protein
MLYGSYQNLKAKYIIHEMLGSKHTYTFAKTSRVLASQ